MNAKQLDDEREAAGAEYVAALETLRKAFVRLNAVERTLQNQNCRAAQLRTFHFTRNRLEEGLRSLQHSEFVPRILIQPWQDEVTAVSDKQIEEFE
ncbi:MULTISPECIES: hypothetical protein [unclassified Bradyrhizobium]|uniref:hypothetical protein n=1 Tax=unclassified Bradyrhizobium TaxID=2631580 RepID=UPI001FF9E014|nr:MULTISPECIES: hypothetical protein [unclassified Bradyrhizobium]MCK1711240.1 hypothetical protein [Bradyrhizobium sp. 143]MCK1725511.1 hypothetical protein [Bradyrhizobium sp. 142]